MTAFEEIKKKCGKATMDLVEAEKALEFYQDVLTNYDLEE